MLINREKALSEIVRIGRLALNQEGETVDTIAMTETIKAAVEEIPAADVPGWVDANKEVPDTNRTVIVAKRLKNGRIEEGLGRYEQDATAYNPATGRNENRPTWVCAGNNNVIAWCELPELPEEV